MQIELFRKKVADQLGPMANGVTKPQLVRADDGLCYVVKDETADVPNVRAAEYFWMSLARAVTLPAPVPEIIEDTDGRLLFGTRREESAAPFALIELLAGRVARGGVQLSRIYAFDLFAANWDRHPGNYLVLADGGGSQAVFAIDFSHLASHPGLVAAGCDPVTMPLCPTRVYFPQVVQPYGADASAAIGIIERLESLPKNAIMSS